MQIQTAPQPRTLKALPKKQPPQNPKPPEDPHKKMQDICFGGALGTAAYMGGTAFPSTYLHELGHKMAIHFHTQLHHA